jgi:hypothetical protein
MASLALHDLFVRRSPVGQFNQLPPIADDHLDIELIEIRIDSNQTPLRSASA